MGTDAARGWILDDPTTWMPAAQLYDRLAVGGAAAAAVFASFRDDK